MNTLISRLIEKVKRDKRTPRKFAMGVQIENGRFSTAMQYVAKRSWVKRRINWDEVTLKGWGKTDEDLSFASEHPLLLCVHNAPLFARLEPSRPCGAIRPEAWAAYADFVVQVIDRYSTDQPIWVELWNEPDVTGSPFPDLFGCWPADGKLYGQMAKKVYKIVKRARPNVMVFCGALAQINTFAMYLPQCDGVSYHSYPKEKGGTIAFAQTMLKAEQLRAMGHRNILLSETSVLGSGSQEHNELQAKYYDYLWSLQNKIIGAFWYTVAYNGWEHSDMVDKSGPKPVWYRYMETLS